MWFRSFSTEKDSFVPPVFQKIGIAVDLSQEKVLKGVVGLEILQESRCKHFWSVQHDII